MLFSRDERREKRRPARAQLRKRRSLIVVACHANSSSAPAGRHQAADAGHDPPATQACPLRLRTALDRWAAATAQQRPPAFPLRLRAVPDRLTAVTPMALQRQRLAPSQRLPYRTTLDRWRAVAATAPHRPPASPLRLRAAVLGRWGATALHRPPAFPLHLRAVLRQAVMATALHRQHPDRPHRLRSRVTLFRWSPVAAMALPRPPGCLLRARAVLRQSTRVALQRQRPAPSQRLLYRVYRAVLGRWRAVAAAARPWWPPDCRPPPGRLWTGGGWWLRRHCNAGP